MDNQISFAEFLRAIYDNHDFRAKHWLTESFLDEATHGVKKDRGPYDNGLTFSKTWSLGGNYGTCYDDEKRPVHAEIEPDDGGELDGIISIFAPQCTFLQYKVICSSIMRSGETYHSDYYGGSTTDAYRGFNIRDLYDALHEHNMLPAKMAKE